MSIAFSKVERAVGVFILVAFLCFLGTLIMVGRGQHWFRDFNTYYAVYKEGYNLQPGVKVQFLRTDIGQVTAVELTKTNTVRITMKILADYASRIKEDSRAAVESPTFIGSEFINIIPGTPEAEVIKPGGQIPSQEAKKISDYLAEYGFDRKMKLLDDILASLSDILNQLKQPDEGLFATLDNAKKISGNIDKATKDITDGRGSVGRLLTQEEMYDSLMKRLEEVQVILKDFQKTSGNVKDTTNVLNDEFPQLLKKVDSILTRLDDVSVLLKSAMENAPEITEQARKDLRDVDEILESVKRNFLIRGNLPRQPDAETHGIQIRGD